VCKKKSICGCYEPVKATNPDFIFVLFVLDSTSGSCFGSGIDFCSRSSFPVQGSASSFPALHQFCVGSVGSASVCSSHQGTGSLGALLACSSHRCADFSVRSTRSVRPVLLCSGFRSSLQGELPTVISFQQTVI
jgi:hypothetical protein